MTSKSNQTAEWPVPERALKALLDAFDLGARVKDKRVLAISDGTEEAVAKDFERFLQGRFAHEEKGDQHLVETLDVLVQELTGRGLDDVPWLRENLIDLERRYIALRTNVPVMWASQDAIDWFVLSRLLVPWAGAFAVCCIAQGLSLDAGMPGGRFWFLPERRNGGIVFPLNRFFVWWQDLLGAKHRTAFVTKLERVLAELAEAPENSKNDAPWKNLGDEIADWVSAKPDLPSLDGIERLAAMAEKLGRAADCEALDQDGDLTERLSRCADFVRQRGLDPEALSYEIPTRPDAIAEIYAAVAGNRPPLLSEEMLEAFVAHIRRRWAKPTSAEIRSRLIVARGVQKIFQGWRKRFGDEKAFGLCGQFHAAYNLFLDLLHKEPEEARKLVDRIVSAPESSPLLGVLKPAGSSTFINSASAFVTGCPVRFDQDPMPPVDLDERGRALQVIKDRAFDLVDSGADLLLSVPDSVTRISAQDEGLENVREEVLLFGQQLQLLQSVLCVPDLNSLWSAYTQLPVGLPSSLIHARVAQRIVDTIEDLDRQAIWHERFHIALARAQDPALGDTRAVAGVMLETWWLTAPQRPKAIGDAERARMLLNRLEGLEESLNGWFSYERIWREARLLAQSGHLGAAVKKYEKILESGTSRVSQPMAQIAWEALAVSSAAGKAGRFKTILKRARPHLDALTLMQNKAVLDWALRAYREVFCSPFPLSRP